MTEGTIGVQKILSRREVAAVLGVSTTTLWRLVQRRHFPPALRISTRRVGWSSESVRRWIDERDKKTDEGEMSSGQ